MSSATKGATSPRFDKDAAGTAYDGSSFIKFADLTRHDVVVIHTGEQAVRDAEQRKVWQRAHNLAIEAGNPIDAEPEPEQALIVSPRKLDEPVKLFPMADKDATNKIIVHQFGQLAPDKAKRLVTELMKQAPNAVIYRGIQGQNAEPWQLVDIVKLEQNIASELEAEILPLHQVRNGQAVEGHVLPEGFEIQGNRLCACMMVGRGDNEHYERVPIASPIYVLADTSNEHGRDWGRLLAWHDRKDRACQWAMPMEALVSRGGDDALKALLRGGLPFIDFGNKRKLIEYLMLCEPRKQVACVGRIGWHGRAYVLPNSAIGPDAEGVILQSAEYASNDFTESSTLAEWQQGVAALAVGNSRLCFGLSLAFAAPLLSLVGMEGGGFHLKGESSDGKTTIMLAGASVYGNKRFCHTWRATGNAIEGIASRRNDALLCLDEIGELDGKEAGEVAYMLANGQGKGRAQQSGELRERKSWRLQFLSTGELSLEDHVASSGKRTQAGMEVRVIQIPSDTGQHGAFEQLHGMGNGRIFADTLKANADLFHGTAIRAFLEPLAINMELYREHLTGEIKRLADKWDPKDAGSQVGRAINRFALVAAAGELATRLGVTGWPEGEAIRATLVCLKAWLAERGHLGNQEDAATLRQIREFFTLNQSHFADWNSPNLPPPNMVGYRKVEGIGEDSAMSFYVLPAGWKVITNGRDPRKAAKLAKDKGWISKFDKDKTQATIKVPGSRKSIKVFVFDYGVIAAEEDDTEAS